MHSRTGVMDAMVAPSTSVTQARIAGSFSANVGEEVVAVALHVSMRQGLASAVGRAKKWLTGPKLVSDG